MSTENLQIAWSRSRRQVKKLLKRSYCHTDPFGGETFIAPGTHRTLHVTRLEVSAHGLLPYMPRRQAKKRHTGAFTRKGAPNG